MSEASADKALGDNNHEHEDGDNQNSLRERRKKILEAREDRLAKIMSLASGRTVDRSEVQVDRTPSPTISERAAAGVGPLETLTKKIQPEAMASSSSTIRSTTGSIVSRCGPLRHTMIIALAACVFVSWYLASMPAIPEAAHVTRALFSPWQVMFATFLGIESIEAYFYRLTLMDGLFDAGLYLFSVILLFKLLAL